MKITLSGVPGSGKSTVRAALAARYHLSIRGTGDFVRTICVRYGYQDITKFIVEYVSHHPEVDLEIDQEQKKFGEENDAFVLDAHVGFLFIPDAIKIFLQCDPEVAAQRILDAKRATEDAKSIQDAVQANQNRAQAMRQNFQKLYKVDMYDEKNFDLVVDTSSLTPDQVVQRICDYIDGRGE
ncbi:MAG: AAA family ATPase [SAR324 cluster bacterium]|nr:AAA family ATPase [SAR324 cluster bacterium]